MMDKIISYLIPFFSESDSFKKFKADLGNATIDWVKPLFLKEDGTPTKEATDIAKDPNDKYNQQALEVKLVMLSRELENGKQRLQEFEEVISTKNHLSKAANNNSIVIGSNNPVFQGINNSNINNGNK